MPVGASVPKELLPLKADGKEHVSGPLKAVFRAGPLAPITALAFTPDGQQLLVGSYGHVSIWNLINGRSLGRMGGLAGAVQCIRYSPDHTLLGVAGGQPGKDGTVTIYRTTDPFQPLRTLTGHTEVVYDFAWSPDSRRIVTGSLDKRVMEWDVASGKSTLTITEHSDWVYAVTFTPDGKHLVSAGRDHAVKEFDAETGKSIRTFAGHEKEVFGVAVTPDGKYVISTGGEPSLRWWKLDDGTGVRNQGGHGAEVDELRVTEDGKSLISAGQDHTVRLWSIASGGEEKSFRCESALLTAALSPDGKRVVAGGADGQLRLWDVASGKLLATGFETPPDPSAKPPAPAGIEWITADGYVAGPAAPQWRAGDAPVTEGAVHAALAQPSEILKALHGEAVTPVKFGK